MNEREMLFALMDEKIKALQRTTCDQRTQIRKLEKEIRILRKELGKHETTTPADMA